MVQNTRKVTEPDFLANFPSAQICAKKGQKGPKMAQKWTFLKIESLLVAGKCLRCMVHHPYVWENV